MEPENKIPDDNKIGDLPIAKRKVIKTYVEDMTNALEDGKGGIIKKIIHSEEQHEIEKRNQSPESKKNKVFMFFGLFLILASIGTLFFFFQNKEVPAVPVAKQFVPLIFTDKNTLLEIADLKKAVIEKKVSEGVNTSTIKVRQIEGIYPTLNKSPVGLRKFMSAIDGSFNPSETNFVEENFLMGIIKNDNSSNSFFMLMKMRSIIDVFEIMRSWESKMFLDLHGFFGVDLLPETKYLLTKNFENGIIENKNARILYDTDKNIVMAYVFADDNSIVITNSENAVREIILRLGTSEVKQ